MKYICVILIVASPFIICVEALRCFQCFDAIDGPCFDPVGRNAPIINCEDTFGPVDAVCFKVVNSVMGSDVVIRGCHPYSNISQFCAGMIITGDAVCLSCREDLCNSSKSFSSHTIIFAILSLLIVTFNLSNYSA